MLKNDDDNDINNSDNDNQNATEVKAEFQDWKRMQPEITQYSQ